MSLTQSKEIDTFLKLDDSEKKERLWKVHNIFKYRFVSYVFILYISYIWTYKTVQRTKQSKLKKVIDFIKIRYYMEM